MGDASAVEFWSTFGTSVLAGMLAAAMCGFLGFFVVIRRVAFVSTALGQTAGLGIASGFLLGSFFGHDPHEATPLYLDPVVIAIVLSAAVAVILSYVPHVRRVAPETVVAFVYLSAAALTFIVLNSPRIVQEAHEVGDLLYGNPVAVRNEHVHELIVVAACIFASQLFLFRNLLFVSFDPEMARTLALPVKTLDAFLHLSIGVAVAVSTRAVGAVPVFGFLVLPAGAALLATESVAWVLVLSTLGALVAAVGGFYLSYITDWPTGSMMVAVAAAYWPLAALTRLFRRR
jgi:zinc transport system permease protein